MLDPVDRTVLTEVLRAPACFRLDQVIATTYTLDLVALLALPLSFILSSGDSITESGAQTDATCAIVVRVDDVGRPDRARAGAPLPARSLR